MCVRFSGCERPARTYDPLVADPPLLDPLTV